MFRCGLTNAIYLRPSNHPPLLTPPIFLLHGFPCISARTLREPSDWTREPWLPSVLPQSARLGRGALCWGICRVLRWFWLFQRTCTMASADSPPYFFAFHRKGPSPYTTSPLTKSWKTSAQLISLSEVLSMLTRSSRLFSATLPCSAAKVCRWPNHVTCCFACLAYLAKTPPPFPLQAPRNGSSTS
jgi:hypothetical protein